MIGARRVFCPVLRRRLVVHQPAARPKRPGALTAASVLMVIHGVVWLLVAPVMLGSGSLPASVFGLGAMGVGGWSVAAPLGFAPGRSTARTAALAMALPAIALGLVAFGACLHWALNSAGKVSGGYAVAAALLPVLPLALSVTTAILLTSRSAKGYLAAPGPS
jgi:hypothetical protein